MRQSWGKLLFLHWPVEEDVLRPRIPAPLELDAFDGAHWIGITPFAMWDIAPSGVPSLPLLSRSLELNVRTYVRFEGEPGIWFFSLDVQNPLMLSARLVFGLPYFPARMSLRESEGRLSFTSRRLAGTAEAIFDAGWMPGDPLPQPSAGTLEHFLVERYALFSTLGGRLVRARVRHPSWTLRRASLEHLSTSLLRDHRLTAQEWPSLVHAQDKSFKVRVWPPRTIRH
jgi:hypothetical protein